ncbi:hypothetical protein JTB14_032370 [Gonioctena quinquepunctata]|nr:hypothetical protein JTB14_032370 [Gonioctena quinquepunctata]
MFRYHSNDRYPSVELDDSFDHEYFHILSHRTRVWRQPGNAECSRYVQDVHTSRGELSNIWIIFFNTSCIPLQELMMKSFI